MRFFYLIALFLLMANPCIWASHPYESSLRFDLPLGLGAAGVAAFGQYRLSQMEPRQTPYNRDDLLPWDRPFAGTWNSQAAQASDWLAVVGTFPLVVGVASVQNGTMGWGDFGTQFLMLYEVLALQSGINLAVRSLQVWPRPFTLGNQGGAERQEGQASGSFYSGHSSAAFSVAVFSSVWFSEVYPHSRWRSWVWAGSLSLAALTAGLRVVAGKHYPSDVIVGALVGGLIGWAVPMWHQRDSKSPHLAVAPQYVGIRFRF